MISLFFRITDSDNEDEIDIPYPRRNTLPPRPPSRVPTPKVS